MQNGNAYEEGLRDGFWKPFQGVLEATAPTTNARGAAQAARRRRHTLAVHQRRAPGSTPSSPDNWLVDQTLMDRPGNKDIQLALF